MTVVGCPECPHCQAAARAVAASVFVRSVRAQLRPWEFASYGRKITSVVDWYDGWWIGTHAETDDVEVPPQIIDKRQWTAGFVEGWNDAAHIREFRRTRRAS